jgi:hypothetical protein
MDHIGCNLDPCLIFKEIVLGCKLKILTGNVHIYVKELVSDILNCFAMLSSNTELSSFIIFVQKCLHALKKSLTDISINMN